MKNILKGAVLCCWVLAALIFPSDTVLAGPHPMTVTFTTQPSNQKICIGSTATFSVTAAGSSALTYQWQLSTDGGVSWASVANGSTYSGATSGSLTVTGAVASFNNYEYRCSVTDNSGTYYSGAGTLTVMVPSSQLTNSSNTICAGATTNLGGIPYAGYSNQWQVSSNNGASWANLSDGGDYSGSSTLNLNITGDPAINGYLYRTVVTDGSTGCSLASVGVDTLHVVNTPAVLQPTPTSLFICPGSNGLLSIVDSTGVNYQWQVSTDNGSTWSNISNSSLYAGTSTYSLTINVPTTAASYQVIRSVTGYGLTCSTPSDVVALTFKTPPAITTPPASKTLCAGSTASFRVTASGSTLTYQWQQSTDGGVTWSSISGGTSVLLSRAAVTPAMDGYEYNVVVSGCGSPLTSAAAILHVNSSGTWLGTADTAWENANNWCGGVPTSATDVLVPAVAPRMPLISNNTGTAYAHSLSIQKAASLSISGGTTSMTAPFNIIGTVIYKANGNQNVFPADHGSLQVDSAGNKVLQSNVAITDTLTLKGSAKLVTGSNILTMKAGSSPIRGAAFSGAQTSWVVTGNGNSGAGNTGTGGLLIAQISGAALFPVGPTPATYNPLQLNNGGAINDFTVAVNDQYIPGAPSGSAIDRTWLVSAANAGSSNVSLGLLWNLTDEPPTFNRSSASIIRSNGTLIVEESAAGAASGANPYSYSKGTFSTMTQFSVATSTMVPLANRLLSFSGQWINSAAIELLWNVDQNMEARSYILQRSADGAPFSDLGTLDGEEGKSSYSFYDNHPGKENLYRVKLVGSGGNINFSQVIMLSGEEMNSLTMLAPSITEQGATNLLLSLGKESNIAYWMTDVSGRVMTRNAIHLAGGQHSLPIDISHIPAGIYFVRVTDGVGFSKVLTLVKK